MWKFRFVRFLAAILVFAQEARSASPWRFWNSADGLTESYVTNLALDRSGRLFMKHGNVPTLTILDGYGAAFMADPHALGRVIARPDGTFITLNRQGIEIYDAGHWKTYPIPEIATFLGNHFALVERDGFKYSTEEGLRLPFRVDMLPQGSESAWILLPDRLLEWREKTGQSTLVRLAAQTVLTRFHDLQPARDGGVWVSGSTGLGHLKKDAAGLHWTDSRAPPSLSDFVQPMETGQGDVLIAAAHRDGGRALIRWKHGAWSSVFSGGKAFLRGWPGPDGSAWIQQDERLLETAGGPVQTIDRPESASGTVFDVLSEPAAGAFWVATSQGLARYSPPLWRTPAARGMSASINGLINSIVEDRDGRLLFLGDGFLLMNESERWQSFPLPSGRRQDAADSESLAILEDGRILIHTLSRTEYLSFDSRLRSFSSIRHPENKRLGHFSKRSRGGAWVQVFDGSGPAWHLEIFDGSGFRASDSPLASSMDDPRVFLESRRGDLWIGGSSGLMVWRNGSLRTLGEKDGFADTGVFSILETSAGTILLGGRNNITGYDGKSFHVLQTGVDRARSICAGPGGIWAASGDGVHREHDGNWWVNNVEDGLPSSAAYKVFRDRRGHMWTGTTRGVALFYPEADPDPPIVSIDAGQNLRETPPNGEVRLAFRGMDKWKYTDPARLFFSHRLDRGNWSAFSHEQLASLTGLSAGAHRFEVRAMDRNGNISLQPAAFQFSVLLAWYRQKAFLAVAAIALFLIGLLLRLAWLHQRKMIFQSRHDALTRLPNRHVFETTLQQAIVQARRNATGVTLLLLDLDNFKLINDSLGHAGGDRYLCTVAARLRACTRKSDTVARIGGDEFAIILSGPHSLEQAESMAEKILRGFREASEFNAGPLKCTASIGLSLFPEHAGDPATLQRLADIAMYRCKARTKNGYVVFDPNENGADFETTRVSETIREALREGYFRLHYQPLEFANGTVAGFEALVRIQHPRLGLIPPGQFIPVAEQTGLIVPLGRWVLEEACRQLSDWKAAGRWPLTVAVNVSSVQLSAPDFSAEVTGVLERTGLPPSALTLEITESAMIANWEQARSQLEHLRGFGFRVAIDDFGTGYSSFSSLQSLAVDYLKIDRSLVRRIDEDAKCRLVLEGLVGLAHNLGYSVVAEGVETAAQASALRSLRCDILQGFYLGKPVPQEQLSAFRVAGDMETLACVAP